MKLVIHTCTNTQITVLFEFQEESMGRVGTEVMRSRKKGMKFFIKIIEHIV